MSKPNRFSSTRRSVLGALLVGALGLAFLASTSGPAAASPLDGPRDAGIVGEGVDGYAAIRDEARATPSIRALVQDINKQRRAYYEERAKEEGVAAAAIARIYAKTIYEKAPSGWWFRTDGGAWRQK
jgi:hypothetical protein